MDDKRDQQSMNGGTDSQSPSIRNRQTSVAASGTSRPVPSARAATNGGNTAKPRKPKYHLVIIVIEGYLNMVINGEKFRFGKRTYVNLPTWSDIYEIEYGGGFHALTTATDRSVVEDIFRNRNPFPPDFKFRIDHGLGGQIMAKSDLDTLCKDIRNMIASLSNKNHYFAEEINYAYFYILLTDMADMVWPDLRYGHLRRLRRRSGKVVRHAGKGCRAVV